MLVPALFFNEQKICVKILSQYITIGKKKPFVESNNACLDFHMKIIFETFLLIEMYITTKSLRCVYIIALRGILMRCVIDARDVFSWNIYDV